MPIYRSPQSASEVAATTPKGYQQLTSDQLASAVGLTVPSGATRVVIQNNGAIAIRWRNDGVDPTADTGQRLSQGNGGMDITSNLSSYKFIREAEGAAADCVYYGG